MDFRLSQEQQLLRDSARRYLAVDKRSGDDWNTYADLGWLAMLVPEAAGGLDAAMEDCLRQLVNWAIGQI